MDAGDGARAVDVLEKLLSVTPVSNVPYSRVVLPIQEQLSELTCTDTSKAKYSAGMSKEKLARATELHESLSRGLIEQQVQMMQYLASLDGEYAAAAAREQSLATQMADRILQVLRVYHPNSALFKELEAQVNEARQALEGRDAMSSSR